MKFSSLFLNIFFIVLMAFTFEVKASTLTTTESFVSEVKMKVENFYNVTSENVSVDWTDDKLEKKLLSIQKVNTKKNLEIKVQDNMLKNIAGKSGLPIEVYLDGKLNTILYVKCKVSVYKNVLVAKVPIKRGELVTDEHFKLAKVSIMGLGLQTLTDSSNLVGKSALIDIKENTVISSNFLKEKVVVFKGNQVTIRIVNGSLTLLSSGEALQEGIIGQNIMIKVSGSAKKTVVAKVIDSSVVEVNLGGN